MLAKAIDSCQNLSDQSSFLTRAKKIFANVDEVLTAVIPIAASLIELEEDTKIAYETYEENKHFKP